MSRSSTLLVVPLLLWFACTSGSPQQPPDAGRASDAPIATGTGGSKGSGGSIATGSAQGTGGASAGGGATDSGGVSRTGGAAGAGGTVARGGTTTMGGATGAGAATDAGGTIDGGSTSSADAGEDAPTGEVSIPVADANPIEASPDVDSAPAGPTYIVDPTFTTTEEDDGMHAFVLPWADRSLGPTSLASMNTAGSIVPITIGNDGHFYRNGARYRLFGINLVIGSCFPTHEQADIIAARLAKFGFNAVRFSACEAFYPYPNGPSLIDYASGSGDNLSPAALDRFEYFVAALRKQGIYLDIILQAARRFLPGDSGDPQNPLPLPPLSAANGATWTADDMDYAQAMGFFYDPVLAAQQRYAKNLLSHVNPYSGVSLAADSAVVSLEVVNETGLIHYWLWQRLEKMDAFLLAALQGKWNTWLKAKYTTTSAIETAWGGSVTPTELLANTSFVTPITPPWNFYVTSPAVAIATPEPSADDSNTALRVDITAAGTEEWHVQLLQGGLPLIPGQAYTLSFRARASSARSTQYLVDKNGASGTAYTGYQRSPLGTDWQTFSIGFTAPDSAGAVADARLFLGGFGLQTGTVWISSPSLKTGGPVLQASETVEAGTVPIVPRSGSRSFTRPAVMDWLRFLRDTEASFYKQMSDYLRKTLSVQAYLIGSQIINSTPNVQAAMDIIDTHRYWDQPQFPGKRWDPANWLIDNRSAVYSPPGVLDLMAAARVQGKPLVATETGHLAPNMYAGEGPLLTTAYAALQDLDAIFQFEWGYAGRWEGTGFVDYTDLDHHPPKLASIPLAASLFRSFDVSPAKSSFTVAMDPDTELKAVYSAGKQWQVDDASTRGLPMAAAAISRVQMNLASGATDSTWPDVSSMTKFLADTGELAWDKSAGVVSINSAQTRAVIGFNNGKSFALGGPAVNCSITSGPCVVFTPGTTLLGHSTIALHLIEGTSFATGAGRALLSATGTVRNTDMQWNSDKTSLGSNWGHGPTRTEAVAASVSLPRVPSEVEVYALDGRGQRAGSVPVSGTSNASFSIGGSIPTVWYEVVFKAATPIGEGNHILDACATYCASVSASLPTCYANTNACLEDCATWTSDTLGGRCDCTTEVDAVFNCAKAGMGLVCGRLSQGVPPSDACLPAYLRAFKCVGKVAPCTANLTEVVVDDFEAGATAARYPGFSSSWSVDCDANSTINPKPFASAAHGANGSGYAAHLTGNVTSSSGFAQFRLTATSSNGVDLSQVVGVAFSAKGLGTLRAGMHTADMDKASNWDSYGKPIVLTSTWHRYLVRFDDPDFSQQGFGAKTAFSSNQVTAIAFDTASTGGLDYWIDDVVLVKAN